MNPFGEIGRETKRSSSAARPREARSRAVSAILGPTNTGKTHYAIERMLRHPTGMIGLPLRLLAREVYNRVVEKVGAESVALITGEEKIKPRAPRYWISTVEAMPRDIDVNFVAIDEAQLSADLDRGHVFTDRLLNRRGLEETLVIGSETIRGVVEKLMPGVSVTTRPRLSTLTFAGDRKISRLPRRTAIVAFSAEEVYAIAEFIRRQRGGAAVVLGALSPRTRNAQIDLYQNGEVEFIVATDAIGMGLNLDVDHVAFASDRKFDGWQYRRLTPAEFGQIAGRAGRHQRDGSFGSTGRCPPFEPELAARIEDHEFDPVGLLQWRNSDLDFASLVSLQRSLDVSPDDPRLTRAPLADDVLLLETLARDPFVQKQTKTRADAQRLWEVCQVPDYRKLSPVAHADLARTLFAFVVRAGRIPDAWFASQLALCDRVEGDLDVLSARVAQVRTLNFIANRSDWLRDPEHWQGVTRRVEDTLSDALHERLSARFVDRRTSVLMRRLRETGMLEAEVTSSGDVMVEGQHVGTLLGFRFTPDPQAEGQAARALASVAQRALAAEIEGRATRVSDAVDTAFVLANDGTIRWLGEPVGRLAAGDHILSPKVRILADDQLTGPGLELVQNRLDLWIAQHVTKLLGALRAFEAGEGLGGPARGIAFQVAESLGVLERARVAQDIRSLGQDDRTALRKLGLRFGAYHLYVPALLKPAPRALAAQLWALRKGGSESIKGLDEVPHLASSGRTSFPADQAAPRGLYLAAGFRMCGERAVRVDILERLADIIRPAIAYRPGTTAGDPPPGAADDDGFVVSVAMTSLAGCSGEAFASILKSLGYVSEKRPGPAITKPLIAAAPREPVAQASAASVDAEPAHDVTLEPSDTPALPTETSDAVGVFAVESESSIPDGDPMADVGAQKQEQEQEQEKDPTPTLAIDAIESEPTEAVSADAFVPAEPEPATEDAPLEGDIVAAQPAEIEVWKPQRRANGPRRNPRQDRTEQNRRRAGRAVTGAKPDAAVSDGEKVNSAGEENRRRPSEFEGERRPGRSSGPQGSREHGRDRNADRNAGSNRFRGPRQDRPGDRGPREFPPKQEAERRRERPIDPDSPFAKLAALKAQLESKGGKDS